MFDRMDTEVRVALAQAADEARELGHQQIGPEHLLLGLLSNVRGAAYRLLAAHGVQYAAARDAVVAEHAAHPQDPAPDEDDPSSSLDDDRDALRAVGIDLDAVRDAVHRAFGEDITKHWGQRRGGTGGDHRHGPPFGPGWGGPEGWGPRGGRGRRGPRSRRFGWWGGAVPLSPRMKPVWDQVHDTLCASGRFTGLDLLHALLEAGDPVVEAVVRTADDPRGLHAAVEEAAAPPTAG